MGAISGDELIRWEKAEGVEAAVVDGGKLEKILVSVRLRPLNAKEIAANDPADWECINDSTIIFRNSLAERSGFPTAYTFDRVFRGDCTTRQVYEEAAKEVALSVVGGINSTIFAYGQTSSGKTYTMSGITEYTVADIYDYIQRHEERAFVLKFSAIEIYNEAVRDLLGTDSTPLRVLDDPEKGTIVEKLTEEILRDWNHLKQLLSMCEAQRQIGETLLNEMSSRSHQILRLTIESSAREFLGKGNSSTLAASVNFVDLAGSERASQALSVGARLKEGCHINRSLLSLGTVIRKLSKGRSAHIPYRDSKLTRILQPSLGGNARTAIICTMSPARSHIEQSRNTLLFASCAKEVATNARVNVVMSDKVLVKHLQKEVARLESELRYPGTNPSTSHFEALLREKDAQIKKMHKEIKELIQQRDLAQSRLQDLLQVVEGDTVSRVSRQWEESTPISTYHVPRAYEDVLLTSESFGEAYNGLDFEFTESASNGRDDLSESYLQLTEKPKEHSTASSRNSINGPIFVRAIPHQAEGVNQGNCEYSEELCKEVQCIEMNGSGLSTEGSKTLLPPTSNSMRHGDHEPTTYTQMDLRTITTNSSDITLEQHLENVRKKLHGITKANPGESSPWSSGCDLSSFRGMVLSRSKSCRETLMKSSSPWLHEGEENDSTPPSISFKDYPGRPERFLRRCAALNYDAEIESPSRDGLHTPARSISSSVLDTPSTTTAYTGGITSIHDFVAGLKEMAHVQYQKQLTGDQETEQNASEDFGAGGVTNEVGLNPASNPPESPSRWPLEFEKKQQEILDLWHACNVSLVHRTYFFLLFKGDPTDSIYMEVELRRLSFLKRMYSQGNPLILSAEGGQKVTLASSIRRLRREREMLWRHMHKRLSAEERESIYTKWGIPLDSKQRKLQLVRRLWTETTDLEHVRESASIVAKLIGLQEQGQALKEMFGLSFTPQLSKQRLLRWKHGNSLRK